jgi:hypothetical protein
LAAVAGLPLLPPMMHAAAVAMKTRIVLQNQVGIIKCQVRYLPTWRNKKLTSYPNTDENLSGQVEVRGS